MAGAECIFIYLTSLSTIVCIYTDLNSYCFSRVSVYHMVKVFFYAHVFNDKYSTSVITSRNYYWSLGIPLVLINSRNGVLKQLDYV